MRKQTANSPLTDIEQVGRVMMMMLLPARSVRKTRRRLCTVPDDVIIALVHHTGWLAGITPHRLADIYPHRFIIIPLDLDYTRWISRMFTAHGPLSAKSGIGIFVLAERTIDRWKFILIGCCDLKNILIGRGVTGTFD